MHAPVMNAFSLLPPAYAVIELGLFLGLAHRTASKCLPSHGALADDTK